MSARASIDPYIVEKLLVQLFHTGQMAALCPGSHGAQERI